MFISVREVPASHIKILKDVAKLNKRSLNNTMLIIIEEYCERHKKKDKKHHFADDCLK